ncbi:MAG: hypothetical protein ABJK39_02030, partial [Hyphomicrobiales bacterium]
RVLCSFKASSLDAPERRQSVMDRTDFQGMLKTGRLASVIPPPLRTKPTYLNRPTDEAYRTGQIR